MKKFFAIPVLLAFTLCLPILSCGDNKDENNEQKNIDDKISKVVARADSSMAGFPNYRYVDLDSVISNYNLAKDYNEEMMRMQNSMQSEVKRHENSLQSKANTMQNKYETN